MRTSLKSGEISNQEFTAPDLAVGAETGAIEGDADHFAIQSVLGHATGDVRVMMLYADLALNRQIERELGAEIRGMQVVGHYARFDAEQRFHALQGFLVKAQRFVILQVADVLAQECVMLLGE